MKKITIAGSINMDIVIQLDRFPEGGETVFGKKLLFIPGGKGANQARAIARLKAEVRLIGKVGSDDFGKDLVNSLSRDGVDTKEVKISQNKTSGAALIGVDKTAENRIIIIPGANFDLLPKDVSQINLEEHQIALSQFEIPKDTIKKFFGKAKSAKCITILNPSPIDKIPKEILSLVDYLVINEYEFEYMFGYKNIRTHKSQLPKITSRLLNKDQTLIITLGHLGSVAVKSNAVVQAPGFKVEAVDTTGAGDSFLGAFSAALAEEKPTKKALIFANAAAALKVTKLGASSMPYRNEVDALIKKDS